MECIMRPKINTRATHATVGTRSCKRHNWSSGPGLGLIFPVRIFSARFLVFRSMARRWVRPGRILDFIFLTRCVINEVEPLVKITIPLNVARMATTGQIILASLVLAGIIAIVVPVTTTTGGTQSGGAGQGAGNGTYLFMVPAGQCDPNPPPGPTEGYAQVREWSNTIYNQPVDEDLPDKRGINTYGWAWGQFTDHDLVRSKSDTTGKPSIVIPFSPGFNLTMTRLQTRNGVGTTHNPHGCHEIENEITAFIDATTVYGDYRDPARMAQLRSGVHGKLTLQAGGFLPYEDETHTNFLAGDVRAGETAILASLHTLFAREHNRWCDVLRQEYPTWSDDQLYWKVRFFFSCTYAYTNVYA